MTTSCNLGLITIPFVTHGVFPYCVNSADRRHNGDCLGLRTYLWQRDPNAFRYEVAVSILTERDAATLCSGDVTRTRRHRGVQSPCAPLATRCAA